MLRAARLSKVMVIGPKTEMRETADRLHSLGLLHVDDFVESVGGMRIGESLEGSEALSRDLVKTRRTMSLLGVSPASAQPGQIHVDDARAFTVNELPKLEKDATALAKRKEEQSSKLDGLEELKGALGPLSEFPRGTRFDLESVEAIAGRSKKDLSQTLKRISPTIRVEQLRRKKHFLLLVYYQRQVEGKLRDILDLAKFEYFDIPEFKGTVRERLTLLEKEAEAGRKALKDIEREIATLRDANARKLLAAEEYLADEVAKAELPLRCATTDNLFTIEGWVRKADTQKLKDGLEKPMGGKVSVQVLDNSEVDEESPVLLKHSTPVRQFQYLVDMYSTPNFKEIDPTLIIALVFPFFFGFMIGDLGYGVILMLIGFLIKKRPIFGIGGNAIGNIIIVSGLVSAVLGLFLFADAFGIPFHGHGDEMDWQSLTGVDIPYHAIVGKLDATSVISLLVLTVFAGFVHMGLALAFGFVNSLAHKDGKHAGSRVGWIFLLISIFLLAMNQAQGTGLGGWICDNLIFNLQASAWNVFGLGVIVPWASIFLFAVGMPVLLYTEGFFALIESLSMLTNLISYTRLAAVGVAKAGLALALNVIFLEMLAPAGMVVAVFAVIMLAVAELLIVVLLGTLSAGIQALRLHYVEFFMKFYEGGGTPFKAFGSKGQYTSRLGVSA